MHLQRTRRWLPVTLLAAALLSPSACTVIYDPGSGSDSDQPPSGDDPTPTFPPPRGPTALQLDAVEPAWLFEGEGGNLNASAIPVVVYGAGISQDATLDITVAPLDEPPTTPAPPTRPLITEGRWISTDGSLAATTVRVPSIDWLSDGEALDLDITLRQGDEVVTIPWRIVGLDELTVSGPRFSTDDLVRERYSLITFADDVHIVGDEPARFMATEAILIDARVDVDGADGGSGDDGGAGACPGGLSAQDGGCGPSAGRGADMEVLSGFGGGGGGFGEPGGAGAGGSGAGAGGEISGDAMLSAFTYDDPARDNRGSGGGGGGRGTVGLTVIDGGSGGGSGGVIELSSDGIIHFGPAGSVSARGGDGESVDIAAGGGGGGSGGAILMRARGGITSEGDRPRLDAAGGSGGLGAYEGGDGGSGRIRVDAASDIAPSFTDTPTFRRGPMWSPLLFPVVDVSVPDLDLIGEGSQPFSVRCDDRVLVASEQFDGGGQARFAAPLEPGLNTLCVHVDAMELVDTSKSEAQNCTRIAYIP
ncbi:hypothetical protein [Haliangium sp.]|uniref:hypothetical protein n=1 Tax=Haliangium sp. TaxID=2663208 RepID=UPI003D0E5E53